MFNFDQAITHWRQQMACGGVKPSEVLDELESHLRDALDLQVRSGVNAREAFEATVEQIGQPDTLKCEFAKIGGIQEARDMLKGFVFTLAGIPNSTLATNMNTSHPNIEPWWATYLKGAAFVVPAIFLWTLSAVFIVPKLQQIARDTGFPTSGDKMWNLTHITVRLTLFMSEHVVLIAAAIIGLLILLEWRFSQWPRYRRATVGVGAFLLNSLVLVSIFIMLVAVMVIAPALAHHVK